VVSVTDPYGRILGFIERSHYFFFQVYSSIVLTRLSGLQAIIFEYLSTNILINSLEIKGIMQGIFIENLIFIHTGSCEDTR
jgi:hypothetical protein